MTSVLRCAVMYCIPLCTFYDVDYYRIIIVITATISTISDLTTCNYFDCYEESLGATATSAATPLPLPQDTVGSRQAVNGRLTFSRPMLISRVTAEVQVNLGD